MNAGTISSLNVTNYSGMNPVINYAGGTITSLFAEGTNGADLVVSGSHEISQLKGTVNVSGSGMLTVSGALQLEKGYTGEKLGVTKDTALTVKDGYTVQVNYKDHVYSISSATEQKINGNIHAIFRRNAFIESAGPCRLPASPFTRVEADDKACAKIFLFRAIDVMLHLAIQEAR